MINKLWNVKDENIEKQSVFWNIMSSGINSIVSMFLLWIVTLVNGVSDAGIFSLGFSTSQMMLTIGNYGMRNYQATDIKGKYTMGVYLSSRVVTNIIMMICVGGFVFWEGYYPEKAIITILLCLLKVTDAVDDVYGGYYQKNGRLDIGGKLMSLRIIAYIIAFCFSLVVSKNLIISCIMAIAMATVVLSILVKSTNNIFVLEKPVFDWKLIGELLKDCLPLCISAFLLIYMGNAPKYAIDANMSASDQAYYTYLFMPCFVTNLFVGFALQPLLVRLSKTWIKKMYRDFLKLCGLIFAGAFVISLVIIIFGGWIGCPILTIVFGVELQKYKQVLIVLLIGGAFFAFAVIEQVILTVMRKQVYLLIGFIIASLTALIISNPLVKKMGLLGAGSAYTLSAVTLFGVLGIMIIVFFVIGNCETSSQS